MNLSIARILVIDDNQEIHNDFAKILTPQRKLDQNFSELAELFEDHHSETSAGMDLTIDFASQGEEAIEMVKRSIAEGNPYSVAFVDVRMPPGLDGIETTRIMWEIDPEIQIVICSAYSDYSWREIVDKLDNSNQFLILKKPFESIEVRQLANALHNRWIHMRCDTLTGLMNRRAFIDCFRREIARATEEESSVTCLMIDIDFFKRVNDLHGHAIGDRALQGIADLLATLGRSGDKVCRYGGEEFCVILRGADEVAAAEWAELVRAQLVKTPIRNGGNKLTVTASFGVASMTEANTTPEQLIEQADSALRSAKQQGRDRVCRFSTLAREHETQKRGCLKRPFHSIDTAQLMSPAMVVKQNATLRDAAEILLKHELAAAPVVDHEGRMVGVLSESDLLRVFSDDSQQSMRVQHAMRASVVGFSEDTSLQEIFDFVVRVSIPQVVIVRDGKPCGVVGRQALLSLLFSQGFGDDQLTQPQATASSLPATIPLTPPPAPGATVPGPASTV